MDSLLSVFLEDKPYLPKSIRDAQDARSVMFLLAHDFKSKASFRVLTLWCVFIISNLTTYRITEHEKELQALYQSWSYLFIPHRPHARFSLISGPWIFALYLQDWDFFELLMNNFALPDSFSVCRARIVLTILDSCDRGITERIFSPRVSCAELETIQTTVAEKMKSDLPTVTTMFNVAFQHFSWCLLTLTSKIWRFV